MTGVIVQDFFSEWLANFRVRLLLRSQDLQYLRNESTEYPLLAEV